MILTSLQFFRVLCSMKDLLTQKLSLHTPNSSFLAMRKRRQKVLKNKHDEPSMVGQILWNRRCFYSTEFLFISILIYIYIYYICGGKCKLTITCSFVFLAVILGSNIACLRFSARAVLILEDSVAFFYSVLGPVGTSMLS